MCRASLILILGKDTLQKFLNENQLSKHSSKLTNEWSSNLKFVLIAIIQLQYTHWLSRNKPNSKYYMIIWEFEESQMRVLYFYAIFLQRSEKNKIIMQIRSLYTVSYRHVLHCRKITCNMKVIPSDFVKWFFCNFQHVYNFYNDLIWIIIL